VNEVKIDVLVYRLLSGDQTLLDVLRKNTKPLKKICNWAKLEDDECYKILDIIIQYSERFHQLPPNKNALRDFVKTSDEHELRMGWSETLVAALKGLNDIDETRLKSISDINVLIESVIKEAEKDHIRFALKHSEDVVNAGPTKQTGKFKDPSGVKDAKAYLLKQLMDDVYTETEIESGYLHEHIDAVAESLDKRLAEEDTATRMKTLMPHVDKAIIIGPQNLSFVGIAGMSGDGKTTILNTVVYNWLKQGFNGLYISFEHAPLEIWEFMAFLHSSHGDYEDCGVELPSISDWDLARDEESGITISPEHRAHMARILRDMKTNVNLPGHLDVQASVNINTFEAFVGYLEAFADQGNYHFAVVDYLARFATAGDSRYRDQETKDTIHKTQILTRNYHNGRGLVVATPMQVNREANKAAKKASEKEESTNNEGSTFYDLNAIANFSEYQHDMDYIFSVYSDEKMKSKNELIMETLKVRKGKRPPLALMEITPGSGRVVEKIGSGVTGGTASTEKFMTDDDVRTSPPTTRTDIVDVGLEDE
jgi:hypothetical protein